MPRSARLHLSFEPGFLRIKQQEPPWRVVRGFPNASGETLAHIHNVSGGILDSDHLTWRADIAAGAQAQITSTGATRIYRSRSTGRTARQDAQVSVGENGYLEYVPDQLIPYAGSRFEQNTRVQLGRQAGLIWWELVAPGREASGEIFQYQQLDSHFELQAEQTPIAVEKWSLKGALDSPARLGPFRHFATCYVCRVGEPAAYWRRFETDLQGVAGRLQHPDVLWGISSLRAHGIVIKGVAASGRSLSAGLIELWRAAKWYLCGRVATLPRKVH